MIGNSKRYVPTTILLILPLTLMLLVPMTSVAENDDEERKPIIRRPMWGILEAELPGEIVLTDDQKEKIKGIWDAYDKRMSLLREKSTQDRRELLALLKKKESPEKIMSLREIIASSDLEISSLYKEEKEAILSVLTDTQRSYLTGDFSARFRGINISNWVGAGSSYRGDTGGPGL